MLTVLLSVFVFALLTGIFFRSFPKIWGYLTALLSGTVFIYFISFLPSVILEAESHAFEYAWVPQLSVNLSFYLDGLSLFFALLISGFGALILWYATGYMAGQRYANRFFAFMLLFMASMLGLVLADNLILLYVFWELTSISSFLLIGYTHQKADARRSALQALLVTNAGGLALLAALILISHQFDTFSIASMIHAGHTDSAEYTIAIVLLILLAALTKSAQFPFHFWLPNAMAAPTPVSAYLHSATMVKAGIFLLFRLQPVFGDEALWTWGLIATGSITMVFGALRSFVETDLKRILAYITISALGLMVGMIGLGTEKALQAALVYLLAHAFYKGALFMVAGSIDHETGSRDIRQLGGLKQAMPFTMVACLLACLSMAGFPPFLGFLGKEMLYEGAMHVRHTGWLLLACIFISSVFYVAISLRIGYQTFFGPLLSPTPKPPREPHLPMWLPPLLLGAGSLALGIFPDVTAQLLESSTQVTADTSAPLHLALWHGFTVVLGLSAATLLTGWALYYFRRQAGKALYFTSGNYMLAPERLYHQTLGYLRQWASIQTRYLHDGYLSNYLRVIFVFLALSVLSQLWHFRLWPQLDTIQLPVTLETIYEWVPLFFMLIGIASVFRARSRLTILLAASMIGFGLAATFVFFSAPDVSMTQFLVETITLLIFMLILNRLPSHLTLKGKTKVSLNLLVAGLCGVMMTLILLYLQGIDLHSPLKEFYLTHSEHEGKGKNVVNVILIDFRALDTLGEITVLGVVAIGIMALVLLQPNKNKK